jgi:hypothetical protein
MLCGVMGVYVMGGGVHILLFILLIDIVKN